MPERIALADVAVLVTTVTKLARERGLINPGEKLALQKGSPANGIQWRLTGREEPSGGLIALDFLPEHGFLGKTAKDAYVRLQYTAAAIKAFPVVTA